MYKFTGWLIGLSKPLELEYIHEVYELEEAAKMPYISNAEKFGMEKGKLEVANYLIEEGIKPAIIERTTGLSSAKNKSCDKS